MESPSSLRSIGGQETPVLPGGLRRSNPGIVRRLWFAGLPRRRAPRNDGTLARRAVDLWRDTDGLMVPYVAVMLPVLVGFALLALDGSRRMSLQTQMQSAADSLALAGARELNKQAGAESRAISAMANAHAATKSSNALFGAGSSPALDYTFTFYSRLSAASEGIGGSAANGDFGREIRRGEDHAARRGQRSFQRRSWRIFQPTHSPSAQTRSPVSPGRACVRSRQSLSATPTRRARDQ